MTDHKPANEAANKFAKRLKHIESRKGTQGELLGEVSADEVQQVAAPPAPPAPAKKRKPAAKKQRQPDFFSPVLYDVGTRDSRSLMDVAPFRLSKAVKRENDVIRYDLPDGHVIVSSGTYGMASVFDYDLVLMAVSHLTAAMNRYRDGKGDKPTQMFRPHVAEVIKFMRKDEGGNQRKAIVGALERLSTTHVSVQRSGTVNGKPVTINEGENLIGPYRTIANAKNKVEFIEFKVAEWMYDEITKGARPDVLTVHPDYFLSESGTGRFIYRLARKAAGKEMATWSFELIHQRSGSTASISEFSRGLRKVIAANDVPEYSLSEEAGKNGPLLRMINRKSLDHLK